MEEYLTQISAHILELINSNEFKVAMLVGLFGSLFGVFQKAGRALLNWMHRRSYAAYSASIAFDQNEVIRAVSTYVRQQSMDSDPTARYELVDALSLERQDLLKSVDSFIAKATSKHLFIFADCGMGKTSFLINYFHRRKSWHKRRGRGLVLVSLSRVTSFKEIEDVPVEKRKSTVLLLDAFDEDPLVLEGVEKRLLLLMELVSDFRNVVITCRSQFFPNDDAIPAFTGIPRVGPTKAGESKEYEFKKIYIAPFDVAQINKYLKLSFPGLLDRAKRVRAKTLVERVPSLALRPMLLAHIADVMEQEVKSGSLLQIDLYQAMASAWVKRESKWVNEKELLVFSRKLAANIFESRAVRGGDFCSRDDVLALAEEWGIEIRLEYLTGRSLLNRTSDGLCKFAHRSIMEYFVVEQLLVSPPGYALDLTDQMQRFLFERVGISLPSDARLALENKCRVKVVAPEERVGYPTNLNIFHVSDRQIVAASVYGIKAIPQDSMGRVIKLGEHIQTMMSQATSVRGLTDIRVNLSKFDRNDDWAIAYISVWLNDRVVLSRLKVEIVGWMAALRSGWSDRKATSLVGRLVPPGFAVESVHWFPATRLDLFDTSLDFDSADGCPFISAGYCLESKTVDIQLMAGAREAGPLAAFGILTGGSMIAVTGRPYTILYSPERLSGDVGKVIEQVVANSPVAERWPDRVPRGW